MGVILLFLVVCVSVVTIFFFKIVTLQVNKNDEQTKFSFWKRISLTLIAIFSISGGFLIYQLRALRRLPPAGAPSGDDYFYTSLFILYIVCIFTVLLPALIQWSQNRLKNKT